MSSDSESEERPQKSELSDKSVPTGTENFKELPKSDNKPHNEINLNSDVSKQNKEAFISSIKVSSNLKSKTMPNSSVQETSVPTNYRCKPYGVLKQIHPSESHSLPYGIFVLERVANIFIESLGVGRSGHMGQSAFRVFTRY